MLGGILVLNSCQKGQLNGEGEEWGYEVDR